MKRTNVASVLPQQLCTGDNKHPHVIIVFTLLSNFEASAGSSAGSIKCGVILVEGVQFRPCFQYATCKGKDA